MSECIQAKDLAEELGIDRSCLLKYVKSRELESVMTRTSPTHQLCIAFTTEQAEAVRNQRRAEGFPIPGEPTLPIKRSLDTEGKTQ